MTLTLTGFDGCTISGLSCDAGSNTSGQKKGKGTISISINGANKGSLSLNRPGTHSSKTVSVTSTTVAEDGTIVVTISATESSLYCYSYTITYTAPAAPTTTVSASPSSITFDAAVLDPVDGAEGSKTTTISLTNGNVGYPGGVSCYLNGWTETDETDCEFYVNSDYTYQYTSSTTSQTVTLSYYATDAGTFEGNFIIQGFNSSHVAVNCTIPLSVTVSAPACANTVTVAKTLAQTNGSISLSSTSVATCGDDASRQVTVTVDPVDCYIPQASEVTWTGTSVTKVSGPTLNGSGNYDYVFRFAQDATGTTTFDCSLATKETYTVSYDAGNTTCTGGNAITGSKANDTKTCGTSLTLPGETFHTTGYTQTGWTKSSCGSKTNNLGGSYTSDAAQTFYPVWSINSYSVTWKVNNVNYSAGGSDNVTHGNHITTLPTAPNRPTYGCGDVFVGWTDVQNYVHGTSPLYTTADEFPNATDDQVFYAVYADYTTE